MHEAQELRGSDRRSIATYFRRKQEINNGKNDSILLDILSIILGIVIS